MLLVFHSSESLLRCAANQQLRLRLGFLFSIYDSDSNGVMSEEEFGYLIEHVGSPQRILVVVLVESTPSHRVERAAHRKMHAIGLVPTSAACLGANPCVCFHGLSFCAIQTDSRRAQFVVPQHAVPMLFSRP